MRKTKYYTNTITRGQVISNARIENNLTLKQLEKIIKVKESYISRIERSKQKPSIKVLCKICKALNISENILVIWILMDLEKTLEEQGVNVSLQFSK